MSVAQMAAGGGGVISAIGAIHEANTQAALEEYQAQQAEYAGAEARAQAAEEERRSRVVSMKALGSARANYGASGVQMDGSPLDVLEESARSAELDALTIRHKGELAAWGYKAEATMHNFSAHQARVGGYISASSRLMQGGSSAAGMSPGGGGGGKRVN